MNKVFSQSLEISYCRVRVYIASPNLTNVSLQRVAGGESFVAILAVDELVLVMHRSHVSVKALARLQRLVANFALKTRL